MAALTQPPKQELPMTDQEILYSLANTLEATRFELDAVRTLLIATMATIAEHPELTKNFTEKVQKAIDGDEAVMVATLLSDESLQKRVDWMRRLVPAQVAQNLQQK